uniref:Uncharacterized protein n=1 Tax=Arundo donax TaxID=35708 RepID=A0A0A9FE13_ARUDO
MYAFSILKFWSLMYISFEICHMELY